MSLGLAAVGTHLIGGPTVETPAGGVGPAVAVEVSFSTLPAEEPVWVDISDFVTDITVRRGRTSEDSRFSAGTAQITLTNEDRRFDPTFTGADGSPWWYWQQPPAAPYYPNVVPMRRVRVRATYAGVTYDVFTGYADAWDQTYQPPEGATCQLTAVDAFEVLANVALPSSAYATEVIMDEPVVWYRLGEPAGSTVLRDSVGTKDLTVAGAPTLGQASLVSRETDGSILFPDDALYTSGAAGAPALTVGRPMSLECVFQALPGHPLGGGALFGQGTYGQGADGLSIIGFEVAEVGGRINIGVWSGDGSADNLRTVATTYNDGVAHHFVFTWDTLNVGHIYIDGVEVANEGAGPDDSTLTGNGDLAASQFFHVGWSPAGSSGAMIGGLDEVAVYDHVLTPERVAAHAAARTTPWSGDSPGERTERLLDFAGWPATDRDIDPGVSTLHPADVSGNLLTMLQKIEETEQGRLYVTAAGNVRLMSRDSLLLPPAVTSQATFGDSDPELEYADLRYRYDKSLIVNEVTVSRVEGKAQTVTDPESRGRYLRRTKTIEGLLHQDDATSFDLANWVLHHYKEPKLRPATLRLEPDAGNAATHYPQVLGRDLVDRVTLIRRPQEIGDPIEQEAWIEGITHTVRAMRWQTTWNLSPADPATQAGVWDTGLWDEATWSF